MAERTAKQRAATRKMIAANKAARKAKSSGSKAPKAKRSKGLAKRASSPPASLGARVARLEGKVSDLRTDVDAHTALFRHIADNSRGLFAGGHSSSRQLGAGRSSSRQLGAGR